MTNPAGDGPGTPGGGYGLVGMAERAELLGGVLEAGDADGGFRVRLRLPVTVDPARGEGAVMAGGRTAPGVVRMTARVLVVDDQTVVREGLTLLLGLLPGIEVVGSAGDGEAALRLIGG